MPEQPKRDWRVDALDMDDFMDLRANSSKKNGSNKSKKRQTRGSRKNDLRDAMQDPDSLDEYMDDFD